MTTRTTILTFLLGGLLACGTAPPASDPPAGGPASSSKEAAPATSSKKTTPATEEAATSPKEVAVALTAILNDSTQADAFVERTAPAVEVKFVTECGGDPRKEETARLSSGEAKRAWHQKSVAMWGKECAEESAPPSCRWQNPLTFMEEAASCDGSCCTLPGAGLHNTPFLTRVCVDAAGKVSEITIEDGC